MRRSAPNTWLYAGYIQRVSWDDDEGGLVRMWDGSSAEVEPGDTVALLRTGQPFVVCVGVERATVEAVVV